LGPYGYRDVQLGESFFRSIDGRGAAQRRRSRGRRSSGDVVLAEHATG
jgi:hypothetical protein